LLSLRDVERGIDGSTRRLILQTLANRGKLAGCPTQPERMLHAISHPQRPQLSPLRPKHRPEESSSLRGLSNSAVIMISLAVWITQFAGTAKRLTITSSFWWIPS
jgi:hypothetical protein